MELASRAEWVTGEEIMQGGILPWILGQACHKKFLKAYMLGGKREIMDFSQLSCWPKYPSPLANYREHVKSAMSPFWDWDKILNIPELRQKIFDTKMELNRVEQLSALSPEQKKRAEDLRHYCNSLQRELTILAQLDLNAQRNVISMVANSNDKIISGMDKKKYIAETTWELMKTEAVYLIDGIPILENDLSSWTFYFCYEMYEAHQKREWEKKGKKYDLFTIGKRYKKRLGEMWFQRIEVEKWMSHQHNGKRGTSGVEESRKVKIKLPASVWAGKKAKIVFREMREKYADEVIAYVLVVLMEETKTAAGRLFYEDDIESQKIEELDVRSFQRKIDTLLDKFNKLYIFISLE